ncbi:MAG: AAA family ATPase, partial [Bacteroidales bacterium]|nr:AAA family ATPase [Bacteroidales bacterium]
MKFPIGIQTFKRVIKEGFVYVDKTQLVYDLVTTSTVVFLGRPRRFGKSLLLSTIENYFLGEKELFKGLAIEALEKEWQTYPVLYFSFGSGDYTKTDELKNVLHALLSEQEKLYGVTSPSMSWAQRFRQVIMAAYEKTGKQVVVLIDEYDKPLLDVMDEKVEVEQDGRKITL